MQLKNSLTERIIRCLLFLIILATCQGLQPTGAAQDLIPLQQGGPHAGSRESSDVLDVDGSLRQVNPELNFQHHRFNNCHTF